jgi:hypothetical protein
MKQTCLASLSLHSLSIFFQICLCGFLGKLWFENFLNCSHKMPQTFKCCAFSDSTIIIVGINNLAICKHAHCTCAFLDGAQSNNTTCISLLYEITIMCTNVIHDVEEQCAMHFISMTKKSIVVDWMFYKIISDNLAMANFTLSSYIRAMT